MQEMPGTRAPVKAWVDLDTVESRALDQVRNVANMRWTHGVALMPDAHLGMGATVGSVIAMRDAVSPAAVGVDIGCGMNAVPVRMTVDQLPDDLGKLRRAIEDAVPVGFAAHNPDNCTLTARMMVGWDAEWNEFIDGYDSLSMPLSTKSMSSTAYRQRVLNQMGTLGGGNHFIEVCADENDRVWLMLHSGSRNVGKELAERHIAIARKQPHNADLPDMDLAVFLADSPQMDAYRRDLEWAQEYARRNRAVMMGLVKRAFAQTLRDSGLSFNQFMGFGSEISCHHNYVSEEEYDGMPLLITRKGAISTRNGAHGIIPGSMGTGSYIVQGLGNEEAFCSASHGAGRRMSRTAARKQFTVEDLVQQTHGVECRKDDGVLDEIPGSYKDLESVMAQQTDLVRIVHKLTTLLCVKG